MCGNIAIDGPAGAGKSTVARKLSERLGYLYFDTGAMYRALTYWALKSGVNPANAEEVVALARSTKLEVVLGVGRETRVLCNGEEVTREIRTPPVAKYVSLVARIPEVRRMLTLLGRKIAKEKTVVEGRDIGTQFFPEAPYKFFLTASAEERARRRGEELRARGYAVDFENLKKEITLRDQLDMTREFAPLKPAEDAVVIDTTSLSPEEVVARILAELGRRHKCFTSSPS